MEDRGQEEKRRDDHDQRQKEDEQRDRQQVEPRVRFLGRRHAPHRSRP
jgi:hypothetical protein